MKMLLADILKQLTRIADALEKKPAVKAKAKADLFDENEDRAFRGKKPMRPMPEGFHLNLELRQFAATNGFEKCDFIFDQFKSHHRSKGSMFANWEAAWRTWILNQVKFNGGAPQQPRPPGSGSDGRI
jgi:hypothetical protein